jgi:hypothetical protein
VVLEFASWDGKKNFISHFVKIITWWDFRRVSMERMSLMLACFVYCENWLLALSSVRLSFRPNGTARLPLNGF